MTSSSFFAHRIRLLAVASGLGLAVHCSSARPPPRSLEGLATMLGQASRSVVAPGDIAWEPSPGWLAETFLGRRLLFLGAEKAGAPRDVYRARVRVTLDGKPIGVTQVRNLTDTPLGDDIALAKAGHAHYFVQCSKAIALGGFAGGGASFGKLRGFRAQRPELGGFSDPLFSQTFSLPDLLGRVLGPGLFLTRAATGSRGRERRLPGP